MHGRILLLSAYDALSHRQWREGLIRELPEYDWTVLTLPARHFSWRIRGNSLTWAFGERDILVQGHDLIVATSMVDLSALRGLVPLLSHTPALVYFHENQFAYPPSARAHGGAEQRIVPLYAALAAERLLFNSEFNRRSFLDGADEFLNKLPDGVPPGLPGRLRARSRVVPVPIDDGWFAGSTLRSTEPFTVVWNHRWEYDKAPERFFAALLKLHREGIAFRVHVLGQCFRQRPEIFDVARAELGGAVGEWGFVADRDAYRDLLRRSHAVVSTALHDFQGLATLEAVAAGCLPVVPDRLAYPEFIPEPFRYPSRPDDAAGEIRLLTDRLGELALLHRRGELPEVPDLSGLAWRAQRTGYRSIIEEVAATGRDSA